MEDNHSRFKKHLEESRRGVEIAQRWLCSKGYEVTMKPHTVAKEAKDWRKHTDSGDIYVGMRVEVKQLSVSFTCRDDWPFGSNFIVCAKHSFDSAVPRPFAYMIISACEGHAAMVESKTRGQWREAERGDRRYENVRQVFYLATLDVVSFFPLSEQ